MWDGEKGSEVKSENLDTTHAKSCLHRGMWNGQRYNRTLRMLMRSVISSRNNIVKLPAINVNASDGVRTFCSYSQLILIVHFLKILLSRSVVILTLLPISTSQILINMMFTSASNGLPICNQRHIQKHISRKSKSTWSTP
jgi:hypothetical protein